jgi:COP9 signalosome complex subunit 4
MAAIPDDKLHGILSLGKPAAKVQALQKLLEPCLGGKTAPNPAAALKAITFIVETIGEHDTAVSQPMLSWIATKLSEVDPDHNEELQSIVNEACDLVQSKYTYFAGPTVTLLRLKSELHQAEEEWKDAAKSMARVDTEDQYFSEVMDLIERTQWRIDCAKLFLENEDNTEASFHIQKARKIFRDVPLTHEKREILGLLVKTCQSQILDSERKFLQAAVSYMQLSQISGDLVKDDDVMISLENAVTCAILAPAGGNRERVLGMLYRDERTRSLEHFPMLEKMYRNMILTKEEQEKFEKSLKEHHQSILAGGLTVFERAMYEHNMLAASKIFKNVSIAQLAELLGVSEDQTEDLARVMIEEGRMEASIDQVDGLIEYGSSKGSVLLTWDGKIQDFCLSLNEIVDAIDSSYPGKFEIP